MSIRKALLIIVGCGVAFAATGSVMGFTMGLIAPWYYRSGSLDGLAPDFSAVRIGLGLGFLQGAVLGTIVGCVAILAPVAKAAQEARSPREWSSWDPPSPPLVPAWVVRGGLALGFVMAVALAVAVGFILGEIRAKARAAETKLARLLPVLAEARFRDVQALVCWHDEVEIDGRVASAEDRRALHARFRSLFGDDEALELIESVKATGP